MARAKALLFLGLATTLATLATPAAAQSRPAAETLRWLDPTAPLHAIVAPRLFFSVLPWLERLAPEPFLQSGATEAAARLRARGLDLTSLDGWLATGLDPERPIAVSALALDPVATRKTYGTLAKLAKPTPKALAAIAPVIERWRVVVPLRDAGQALSAVRNLCATGACLADPASADAAKIAALLGIAPKKAAALRALFKARQVVVIAPAPEVPVLVFARIDAGFLVIDVLRGWAGLPAAGPLFVAQLPALLGRPGPNDTGASAVLTTGAGARLDRGVLGVWLHPERILDHGIARGRGNILEALANVGPELRTRLREQGEKELAQCELFRPIAHAGLLGDAALVLDASPDRRSVELTLDWALRGTLLAELLRAQDHGLLRPELAGDMLLTGVLRLGRLGDFARVPLDGVFADFRVLGQAIQECGHGGSVVATVFAWPQLLRLAAGQAELALAGLRELGNLAVVVRTPTGSDPKPPVLFAAEAGAQLVANLSKQLEMTSGAPLRHTAHGRTTRVWQDQRALLAADTSAFIVDGGPRPWLGIFFGWPEAVSWLLQQPAAPNSAIPLPLLHVLANTARLAEVGHIDADDELGILRRMGVFALEAGVAGERFAVTVRVGVGE